MPATPQERALGSRIAAYSRWARETDRPAATRAARLAFERRFEDEVDPERLLLPQERAVRAEAARKSYFARLALRSARSRRRAAEEATLAAAAEQEIATANGAGEGTDRETP
jgi:hypothetical protein